ncbi:methyltransferase family protein [Rhodovulum imhoffii]|uniref:Methyltransferase family protein n=1 Tax=Rhodovulum imhoffii TaxID=365340 RepID=A0A2T5BU96_9RHOB|nr:class I SAM-dependent methyltransferase [Rhodovulum imhoffii]MBK5934531.1 hypothetical protein [Rhodovulum imhoffii]PTN03052.1 methyltransferase family protein [Rhodovulum imhoffii]
MSYFAEYLKRTDARAVSKWLHYFEVYGREFGRFRGRAPRFLEIGIWNGGSIPMWKGYFGTGAHLVFADIDPACRKHAEPETFVEIGDQSDPAFLARLGETHGPFDAILDDGGHFMHQQITSFEHLWPHLRDGGVYMVEDTHTSYWPGFGGGYREPASFIEFAKGLIDRMHSWYTDQDAIFPFDEMARQMRGIRFYDSIVAVEKHLRADPPTQVTAANGQVRLSRRPLAVRGRKSAFPMGLPPKRS